MTTAQKQRPKYYDLNLAHLPVPGLVSIFHRISGALLFFPVLPVLLWLLQSTLASEQGWLRWRGVFADPAVKVVVLAFAWLYLHHFFAGIRYLLLDVHIGIAKEPATLSARLVMAGGVIAAILIGARIW